MSTQCTPDQLEFQSFGRRQVTGRFDGGRLTSDGGGLLLREVERRLDLFSRLAGCFTDYRRAGMVEHPVESLLAQRVYGLALGYEDINDHDTLRNDSLLALLVGKADLTGERRRRVRDQGYPLAGSSTLNRLELGTPEHAHCHRYQKVVASPEELDRLLVDVFLESHRRAPSVLWLDLDATDDPLHGKQEGRFFHGYYKSYCYLPLYIFCGEHLLCARLRPADRDAQAGSVAELARIIRQLRQRWPKVQLIVRGDSGFCREELMAWCETNKVGYLFGLAKNPRLETLIAKALQKSHRRYLQTRRASRRFRELRYRTRTSWSRTRRVVAKAEHLAKGPNPRFVVTNLDTKTAGAQRLYEELYCARGEMENRIKEQQLDLFADRTSTATLRANQLRLYLSSFAYLLMHGLRRLGLAGTRWARAQCGTIRTQILKVSAHVRITARRVWLAFASGYPHQAAFAAVLQRLQNNPAHAPPG
ncbi:MAG: IS1380 family transposase [Gammaproteobacteria bacterium]|nr:IS1380 family transposase [Gammaproteobacteria bacterium]